MQRISLLFIVLITAVSIPSLATAQSDDAPVTIAVISDLNSAYGSTDYDTSVHSSLEYIIDEVKPDLVLCSGDMIAGQKPELTDKEVRSMWKAFDENIARKLRDASIPFAFTIGNHDGSGHPPHQRDRDLAKEYWKNPAHQPNLDWTAKEGFPFYYSFNLEDISVAVWDASTAAVPDSNLVWLKDNFSEAPQDDNPRLLIGHLPLYGVAHERNTPGNVLKQPRKLQSLMKELNIGLYISGHHHAFYPAHKDGLQLLHTGAIGSGPRQLLTEDKAAIKAFTILDVYPSTGRLTYESYNVESWNRIPHTSLPDSIENLNGTIYLSGEEVQLSPQ